MRAVVMELLIGLILSFFLSLSARGKKMVCTKKMTLAEVVAKSELLEASDRVEELVRCLKIALEKEKRSPQLWRRQSSAVSRYDAAEALRLIEQGLAAVEQDVPGSVGLWALKAEILDKLRSDEQAEAAYKQTRSLLPSSDLTWYNLGFFYMTRNRYEEALVAFLEAAKLNPKSGRNAEAVGAVYFGNGLEEEALPWMRKAVELSPDQPNARMNLANALGKLEKSNEAVKAYANVLRLDPNNHDAACKYAYFSIQVCDWKEYNNYIKAVQTIVKNAVRQGQKSSLTPFNGLIMPISINDQLLLAKSYASVARASPLPPPPRFRQREVIRVGYLSADFRNHPMGRELSALLPLHNRSDFVFFCYAQNPPHSVHDGKYRKMFVESSEALREINPLSDEDAAKMIRGDDIDILVDLMGYTHGARDGLLAMKPGRVQIGFKGYMSTTGGDFLSHLVSDAVSVSPELAVFYSEKQQQLGMLFSSSTHAINHPEMLSPSLIPRKDAGLPEEVFIFACFNTLYKVTPTLFLAWLKILRNVPKSVLWLLEEPADAKTNLCNFARERGVDCTRLIFTKKVPLEKHLQVKANADLFLDTPMYNAHSTAADALWAGVPVLTLAREKMAARVGASLALSLHMPELIMRNMEEYVSAAILLAKRRKKLRELREKLLQMRTHEKVKTFNVSGWMTSFERSLRMSLDLQSLSLHSHFHIIAK